MEAHRLLLVDEDSRTTRRFAAMLEEDGWTVEVFTDSSSAIERLGQLPAFDAIVTEFVRGVPVHAAVVKRRPQLPVIFVTNYAEHLARMNLEPAPVILSKPLDYTFFTAELNRVVGRVMA